MKLRMSAARFPPDLRAALRRHFTIGSGDIAEIVPGDRHPHYKSEPFGEGYCVLEFGLEWLTALQLSSCDFILARYHADLLGITPVKE